MQDFIYDLDSESNFLTPAERELRLRFVNEYVKDYDGFRACLRIGFTKDAANKWSNIFLYESNVNVLIKETELKKAEESEDQRHEDVSIVMNTLREAAQNGAYNTRVSAATTLAKILGLDKIGTAEEEFKGGVLLIPEIANIDAWEIVATESQKELVKVSLNEV